MENATSGQGRDGRLVGIDVARWVALIGMIGVHTMTERDPDGTLTWVETAFAGRSSALFAVLLGVSLALMTGGATRHHGDRLRRGAAGIVIRAVLVGLIGLLLGELDSGIAVILASYAVLMVAACAFLTVPWPWLLGGAVVWCGLGPVVSHVVRDAGVLPAASRLNPTLEMLTTPGQLVSELAVTGYYPALTWLAYALLGLAIGRMPLRSVGTAAWLAGVGAVVTVVAVVASDAATAAAGFSEGAIATSLTSFSGVTPTRSFDLLLLRAPHSGTPFDLLTTSGSAAMTIGACLLVIALAGRISATLVRVLAVAFGAGTATLTLYSLHVWLRTPGLVDGEGYPTYVAHVAIVSAIGAALVIAGRRGPLEWLTGVLPRLLRRHRTS